MPEIEPPEAIELPALARYSATRYLVPLREGGSLPAVVEVEGGGLFVLKFRGAGQGPRALVAELIVGRIGQALGLPVPELALVDLDRAFERFERDQEIQDLLKASQGLNVGMRYLDGAFNYDLLSAADLVSPDLAAEAVWLDALCSNIDRSARNPNILIWQRRPWLIDHGAALYFHHRWPSVDAESARRPFAPIGEQVLLPIAGDLAAADARLAPRLDEATLRRILGEIPEALLEPETAGSAAHFDSADANRQAYLDYLMARLEAPRAFVEEAIRQQAELSLRPPTPLAYRR